MVTIKGKGASEGIAKGRIRLLRKHTGEATWNELPKDPADEMKCFHEACSVLMEELALLGRKAKETAGEAEAEIFDIHRMMLEDDGFVQPAEEKIREGMSAAGAVQESGLALAEMFSSMNDPYMQAREADIRGITERLIQILNGEEKLSLNTATPVILAAEELTPAQTIELDKRNILGFVTEKGTVNSHTAILARTLNIPAVTSLGTFPEEIDGKEAILDGKNGILIIEPDTETSEQYNKLKEKEAEYKNTLASVRNKAIKTKDNREIHVYANAGSLQDVEEATLEGAEGIGLFRSEFLFMQYDRCPTEDEQFSVYKAVLDTVGEREVIIRTLDAGADKQIPWLNRGNKEDNPALGLRAVRICLQNPGLLYTQLRALYRASAYGKIRTMIPMISIPEELDQVLQIAENVKKSLEAEKIPYNQNMPIGIMIETPSAALLAGKLAEKADFFSLGTNDLTQYTMAADRENAAVSYLTEHMPEAVKKLIRMTADAAGNAGIPLGICGELASDPSAIPFLLESGITKFSVSPGQILKARHIITETLKIQ